MKILGIIIGGIFWLINGVLWLYMWIVIIKALMSWIQPNRYNPIVVTIDNLTDPPLKFINKYIPTRGWGIDFSPMILIFTIWILEVVLKYLYTTYIIPLFK